MTKEIKDINDALKAYYEKHDGKVVINASVFAFDDNGKLIDDDHIWNSGLHLDQKNNIEIMMDEFTKLNKL